MLARLHTRVRPVYGGGRGHDENKQANRTDKQTGYRTEWRRFIFSPCASHSAFLHTDTLNSDTVVIDVVGITQRLKGLM